MNRGIIDGWSRPRFTVEGWRDPALGGVDYEPVRATGSAPGAPSTWPAVANTLSGWTEIVASSPYDCCAIDVVIFGGNLTSTDSSALFDIGTGPGGSETVLIDGIPTFGKSVFPYNIRFPIRVAAGTRFAWRMQAANTSITSTPAVGIGFIRDIPEFPAGSSVAVVGTVDRANSTYTNISTVGTFGQHRRIWGSIGSLPVTGKAIYAIPFATSSATSSQTSHTLLDFGWVTQVLGANVVVPGPAFIFASQVFVYITSSEVQEPHVPTIWLPEGLQTGSIVAASDMLLTSVNKLMCFLVME